MKIVADKHVPFLEGVFEPYGEVIYIDGREINHNDIIDADALIIRTRTKCNAELLEGTKVSMIATATIGMDHIARSIISRCIMHRAAMQAVSCSTCFRRCTALPRVKA